MQAFKDAETCGAYIGFIAGVLGANPARAESLVAKMLADRSGRSLGAGARHRLFRDCRTGRNCSSTFVDRMPMRRAMIDKYLDGNLPTLEQIDYAADKARHDRQDQEWTLQLTDKTPRKPVTLAPSPELIDVLWGYYLATGTYAPIGRIDQAAAARQRSRQCRQPHHRQRRQIHARQQRGARPRSAQHAEMVGQAASPRTSPWCSTTSSKPRRRSTPCTCARNRSPRSRSSSRKVPNSKRELSGWGQVGQGALSMGCVVAAATGQIELGIPCVLGGAAYSAGMQYVSH